MAYREVEVPWFVALFLCFKGMNCLLSLDFLYGYVSKCE